MDFFKDFDQNSGCQPYCPIIQMNKKFFQELDDCRIFCQSPSRFEKNFSRYRCTQNFYEIL